MTSPKVRNAAAKFWQKSAERHEPRHAHAIGTVSSVSRNAAGQIVKATVTLQSGATVVNLDAGGRFGMGVGAKVLLDGVGSKAAPIWEIKQVIDQATGTPGTGTGEIVSTPVHAFIESAIVATFAAGALISAEFGFYLIGEQWQYDQAIAYEVEARNDTTLAQAYKGATQPYRRVAGGLKTAIDDNDTTIEVQPNSMDSSIEFDHTNGIALIGSELVRYESVTVHALYIELVNCTRGYASTTPVAHSVGDDVTWRGMSLPIPNLQTDTGYEVRVRAVNANGNPSNWSDWESFNTTGGIEPAEERAADLITNGTFNSDVTGWTLTGIHAATLAHAPAVGLPNGGGAAYIEEDDSPSPTSPQLTQSAIPITAGNAYRVRLYATVDGDVLASDSFRLRLLFNAVNGDYESVTVMGDQMGTLSNNKWLAFETQGIAPHGATEATVRFDTVLTRSGGGEQARVYVDSVSMWELGISKDALAEEALQVGGGATVTGILSNTATLNFGSISTGVTAELTITVTGAATGDACMVTPASGIEPGLVWSGYVSAADTVTVRVANIDGTGLSLDPASRSWRATVFKF